jgi:hypothetical protein
VDLIFFPLQQTLQTGSVPPPGSTDIAYLFFLFFFSILILNLLFSMDIKERVFMMKKALFLAVGSALFIAGVLTPDIFLYQFRGVHYDNVFESIPLYSVIFILLFSGLSYIVLFISDDSKFRYLNVLFAVTANFVWMVVLIVTGRTWYWAPQEQGYFGGFYSAVLFYFVPVAAILMLLKFISLKLLENDVKKKLI